LIQELEGEPEIKHKKKSSWLDRFRRKKKTGKSVNFGTIAISDSKASKDLNQTPRRMSSESNHNFESQTSFTRES
jgi:hypothetical protein